jgi:hypothetical protein
MGSTGKRKTTMAKLNRERGLADRRMAKEARKAARKQAAADGEPGTGLSDLPPEHLSYPVEQSPTSND